MGVLSVISTLLRLLFANRTALVALAAWRRRRRRA